MLNELQETSLDTPKFSLEGQTHIAKCVKCYDGDTIHIVFKFNKKYTRFVCRLQGINTAEMNTENGKIARDILASKVLNKLIIIQCGGFGKYGRLLGTIYEYNEQKIKENLEFKDSINQFMLDYPNIGTVKYEL